MKNERLTVDHVRAALRSEESKLKELLDAIELNDVSADVVVYQVRRIEEGLRRIRRAA
jgi:hypothetical protein